MIRSTDVRMVGMTIVAALVATVGCNVEVDTPVGDAIAAADDLTLSTTERQGVQAALSSIESLTHAAGTAQATTGTSVGAAAEASSFTLPESGELAFGICPQVLLQASLATEALSASVDYGDGCTPLAADDYLVSGTATGTYTDGDQAGAVDITINITVNNASTLDGEIGVAFTRTGDGVDLDGDWDISYTTATDTIVTDATGLAGYESVSATTTFVDFEGTVSDGTTSWEIVLDAVATSYQQNANFIPFAGSITLTGSDIRMLTVTFNSDSPSTGVVEVTVDSLPSIEVNLFDVE